MASLPASVTRGELTGGSPAAAIGHDPDWLRAFAARVRRRPCAGYGLRMLAARVALLAAAVNIASPTTAWAQPADPSGASQASAEDGSRAEPPERVVPRETPPRAAREPRRGDPWEGWTPQERSNFAFAWFPGLFLGIPGFIATTVGASLVASDPESSADPGLWSAVAVIPAAGPWIRLLDPGIESYGSPVAIAIANTLMLTGLLAGISLLATSLDRSSP